MSVTSDVENGVLSPMRAGASFSPFAFCVSGVGFKKLIPPKLK